MNLPPYLKWLPIWVVTMVSVSLFFFTVIGGIKDTIEFITPLFTKIGIILVIIFWVFTFFYAKHKGIPYEGNFLMKNFKNHHHTIFLTLIFLLFLPRFFDKSFDEKASSIINSVNSSPDDFQKLIIDIEEQENAHIDKKEQIVFANIVAGMYKSAHPESKILINAIYEDTLLRIKRRVDLIIEHEIAGKLLIAVKLIPKNINISTSTIINFKDLMQKIGASKGVIIGNGDYSDKTIEYARKESIDLSTYSEANSINWKNDIKIPTLLTVIDPIISPQLELAHVESDGPSKDTKEWILSTDGGKTTFSFFEPLLKSFIEIGPKFDTSKVYQYKLPEKNTKVLTSNNNWIPVKINYLYKVNLQYYYSELNATKYREVKNTFTGKKYQSFDINLLPRDSEHNWIPVLEMNKFIESNLSFIKIVEFPRLEDFEYPKTKMIYAY